MIFQDAGCVPLTQNAMSGDYVRLDQWTSALAKNQNIPKNVRLPVYLAAGQILHVSGKADVLDCHLVIQNTEKSWEMRVFDASLDPLRAPHSSG
jgi:hypothetical protein